MPTPGPLPLLPDPLGVPLDDQPLDDGHRLDEGHQDELGQADELLDELHPDELLLDQPLDEPLELPEVDPEELPELLPDELPLDDSLDDEDDDEQHPSSRATTSHLRLSSSHLASPNVPAGTDSAGGQSHPAPEVDSPLHRSGQTTPIES